jgi:formiminotetrahydrofolate cyclodeaminase
MKNYRYQFREYLDDLAARQPSPGGGSAVSLIFCIGMSLIEMALQYSANKNDSFKKHIVSLRKLRRQIYPYIDLDAKIFEKIMRTTDPLKKVEYIRDSEKMVLHLGLVCHQAFLLAKKVESGIKSSIISDFYIGLDCIKTTLRGCMMNLEANVKMFGKKSRYIAIFRGYLKKWE